MVNFATLRATMVDSQLRTNDVNDPRVLAVMGAVPRERFLPPAKRHLAYVSEPVALSQGRSLLDPRAAGKLMQLAEIAEGDVVLVVGAGTGYLAAVAAGLASAVVALEEDEGIAQQASTALRELQLDNVSTVNGRLADGVPGQGPFDVILIGGAADEVPQAVFAQLKEGGRLAVILRQGPLGRAHLFVKSGGALSKRIAFDATVPVLPELAKAPGFVF
ncbi:MAG: protein-L-isoaspartate O-methyltransferase [Alphaproteobacteria bacterium]|nr:protein-L-isoaspartate O-methyltransferase [Alphaproteobacteria bacterium]